MKTENSIESFDFCQLENIVDFYRTLGEIEDADFIVFLFNYKLDYEKYNGDKRWQRLPYHLRDKNLPLVRQMHDVFFQRYLIHIHVQRQIRHNQSYYQYLITKKPLA